MRTTRRAGRAGGPALAALLLAVATAAPLPAAAQAPASTPAAAPEEESPEVLPAGPGRDETFYACVPCHSTQIVRRQGLGRERWAETLDWMVARHNMPALETAERALILDYLAKHFGPGAAAEGPRPFYTPPPRRNPFQTQ